VFISCARSLTRARLARHQLQAGKNTAMAHANKRHGDHDESSQEAPGRTSRECLTQSTGRIYIALCFFFCGGRSVAWNPGPRHGPVRNLRSNVPCPTVKILTILRNAQRWHIVRADLANDGTLSFFIYCQLVHVVHCQKGEPSHDG
jgi:hypothetical protein